jgi:hypothetical protein
MEMPHIIPEINSTKTLVTVNSSLGRLSALFAKANRCFGSSHTGSLLLGTRYLVIAIGLAPSWPIHR